MRRKRFLGFFPALCLLALPLMVFGQNGLMLEKKRAEYNSAVDVALLMDNSNEIQGLVAVAEWDTSAGVVGTSLVPVGPLADTGDESDADTVVTRLEDGYMIVGVVMDSNPSDNGSVAEVIPPGADTALAVLTLQAAVQPDPIVDVVTPLTFADGKYAMVVDGPVLDNIVVVGGLSIGVVEGLVVTDGELVSTPAPDKLIVESATVEGSTGDVRILMDAISGEVEGFVVAVCYDPVALAFNAPADNLDLLGADDAEADFVAVEESPDGLAVGVVIDLIDPMAVPPNIEPGKGKHVLTLTFDCLGDGCPLRQGDPCVTRDINLCDNVIGDPVKENLIVVGGLSIAQPELVLESGAITFCGPERPLPTREFDCGDGRDICCSNGIDDDGDGLIDMDDPDCQTFTFEVGELVRLDDQNFIVEDVCLEGSIGGEEPACGLLYINPVDVDGDGPDPVQGFSIAMSYDCAAVEPVDEFDVTGTILGDLDAEFVGIHHGSEVIEEDTVCSMVLGVLVDALPPFDGLVIPPLPIPQALGTLCFNILEGVECDVTVVVEQAEGVKGGGNTPTFTLVSVDNYPYAATVRPISICPKREALFYRGDCNGSGRNGDFNLVDPVEVADAAAVVSYLFGGTGLDFDPPCLDACDANDDARIDLGDALAILYFLFVPGTNILPDPYPGFDPDAWPDIVRIGRGPDNTPDDLDCVGGSDCDIIDPVPPQ